MNEVMELTLRFLFGDPTGPKATGSTGAASHPTLGLCKAAGEVRKALWPSRKAKIKAVLADDFGRFDKQELPAHIVNNALGPTIFYIRQTLGASARRRRTRWQRRRAKHRKPRAQEVMWSPPQQQLPRKIRRSFSTSQQQSRSSEPRASSQRMSAAEASPPVIAKLYLFVNDYN